MSNTSTLSRDAARVVVNAMLEATPFEYVQAMVTMLEPLGYKVDGDEIITPDGVILPPETMEKFDRHLAEMDADPSSCVSLDELIAELHEPIST